MAMFILIRGQVFDLGGVAGGVLASKAAIKSNPGAVIAATREIKKLFLKM